MAEKDDFSDLTGVAEVLSLLGGSEEGVESNADPETSNKDDSTTPESTLPDLNLSTSTLTTPKNSLTLPGLDADTLKTSELPVLPDLSSLTTENAENSENTDFGSISKKEAETLIPHTREELIIDGDDGYDHNVWFDDEYPQTEEEEMFASASDLRDDDSEDFRRSREFRLDLVLGRAIDMGASDVHIMPGDYVSYRILGKQIRIREYGIVSPATTEHLVDKSTSFRRRDVLAREKSLDTSYTLKTGKHVGRRTRLAIGHSDGERYLVFRVIADSIPTISEIGIPEEVVEWTGYGSGLILINGATGSGKSTTLASLIQNLLNSEPKHLITLEKPVEYLFTPSLGTVVQREVGADSDVPSFSDGLVSALRSDPDIIFQGEVRDRVEVDSLLAATETGHLTMSTIHANSVAITVSRIRNLYEGADQQRILTSLADVARGLMNQVLVRSPDGTKRTAVREILTIDEKVAKLIAVGDTKGIYALQTERHATMEHELLKAVIAGYCDYGEAIKKAPSVAVFKNLWNDRQKFL